MKNRVLVCSVMLLVQACSTPRYAYYFDHRHEGRDNRHDLTSDQKPLAPDPGLLTASTGQPETNLIGNPSASQARAQQIYQVPSMPINVHTLPEGKSTFLNIKAAKSADNATPPVKEGSSKDLRMAEIFGAAGLVGLVIGGSTLNVLGGISILIGLVFFVRWLIRR